MKSYVCDVCQTIISNPHTVKMKEFYVGYTYEIGSGAIPINSKRREKLHMCSHCWQEFLKTCLKREGKSHEQT